MLTTKVNLFFETEVAPSKNSRNKSQVTCKFTLAGVTFQCHQGWWCSTETCKHPQKPVQNTEQANFKSPKQITQMWQQQGQLRCNCNNSFQKKKPKFKKKKDGNNNSSWLWKHRSHSLRKSSWRFKDQMSFLLQTRDFTARLARKYWINEMKLRQFFSPQILDEMKLRKL